MVHRDCYVTITAYLHKTPAYPVPGKCLLRNDHHGPRLAKYDHERGDRLLMSTHIIRRDEEPYAERYETDPDGEESREHVPCRHDRLPCR